jgi:hypothetical protein
MAKIRFSERVDFTYFVGAGISSLFIIISMYFYKRSGLPMTFAIASFCSYSGVIIRGLFDRESWGKTEKQRKWSAFFGFISVFVIVFIGSVLLLTKSFELSKVVTRNYIVYCFAGLVILFFFLYTFWFKNKNLNLKSFSLSKPPAPNYRD